MESQPDEQLSHRHVNSKRQLQIAVVLICALPFVVQSVFYDGGFYYDDGFHLEQCELISSGKISLADYVFLAHGEHLIPVWKTMFYACWWMFGESSPAFHIFVTVFHVASSLLLLAVLRRYVSDTCAMITSVIWAGAAVGGWDGPFLWIAASHLSIGSTFFLAAMFCLTRMNRAQNHRWAWTMGTCLLTCLSTMGSLVVLTPALLFQYWLFEKRPSQNRRLLLTWLMCWLVPCLVVGMSHLIWVLPAMERLARPPMNVLSGIQMLSGGYAASSWNLFLGVGNPVMWGRIVGGALVIALLLKSNRSAQKLCLLFFVLSFSFSSLAYMARSGWEVSHVLMWGRYRYLPTLFWCVVLGAVLDQMVSGLSFERKKAMPVVAAVVLSLFVLSQYRIASDAATVFRQIATEAKEAAARGEKTQASAIDIDTIGLLKIQFRTA